MADVTVRGCAECPLHDVSIKACTHSRLTPSPYDGVLLRPEQRAPGAPPPSWCPLRAGPLTVRLEVRDGA